MTNTCAADIVTVEIHYSFPRSVSMTFMKKWKIIIIRDSKVEKKTSAEVVYNGNVR